MPESLKLKTKSSKRITIEISTETYDILCGAKAELEYIFKVNVTFDKLLKVLTLPRNIDFADFTIKNSGKIISETKKEETSQENEPLQ